MRACARREPTFTRSTLCLDHQSVQGPRPLTLRRRRPAAARQTERRGYHQVGPQVQAVVDPTRSSSIATLLGLGFASSSLSVRSSRAVSGRPGNIRRSPALTGDSRAAASAPGVLMHTHLDTTRTRHRQHHRNRHLHHHRDHHRRRHSPPRLHPHDHQQHQHRRAPQRHHRSTHQLIVASVWLIGARGVWTSSRTGWRVHRY